MVQIFRNAQALIAYITSLPRDHDSIENPQDSAVWFCCCQEGKLYLNTGSEKDIACLFLDGVEAYKDNPIQRMDSFLDTILEDFYWTYEDYESHIVTNENGEFISQELADECGVINLVPTLKEHYGLE